MGWGEPHNISLFYVAAQNLAESVNRWNIHRTTSSEEQMLNALAEYYRQSTKAM